MIFLHLAYVDNQPEIDCTSGVARDLAMPGHWVGRPQSMQHTYTFSYGHQYIINKKHT